MAGAQSTIERENLVNRTDCGLTRLENFYVLASSSSMQCLGELCANTAVTQC